MIVTIKKEPGDTDPDRKASKIVKAISRLYDFNTLERGDGKDDLRRIRVFVE